MQKIPSLYRKIELGSKKYISWAAFFMAYPFWIIVQNVSFIFMILFYQKAFKLPFRILETRSLMSIFSILFILGSFISTIGAGINLGYEYFKYSVIILPNYIYWAVLIITLGNLALKVLTLEDFYKMFFYGIIAAIVTFFFFKPFLKGIPIYRNVTQNNFAFLLICFSPMATYFVHAKWKNTFYTICAILVLSFCGITSGSRSGSILVFAGSALIISIESWIRIIILIFFSICLFLIAPQILNSPSIKAQIFVLNERTYDLLYETDQTLQTDRSYLTRLAMIEKGLNIFEQYPLAGVGIGNFSNKSFEIDFNFEGAEYIEGKEDVLESSTNPHNSYISFLSEGGLFLLLPALSLMFYPIFFFIFNYQSIKRNERAVFISIIFMCIHAWFIAGMVNVYGWFILGLANAITINHQIRKNEARVSLSQ